MSFLPDFDKDLKRILVIGNFDGVHLGHQKLIEMATKKRSEKNTRITVMTFEPHPSLVFGVRNFSLIQDYESRYCCLKSAGADEILRIPFTDSFLHLTSLEFIQILRDSVRPEAVCIGFDFRFGFGGEGTVTQLETELKKANIPVYVLPRHEVLGQKVSSSRIRELLKQGNLAEAEKMLGRKHFLTGSISPGHGIGKNLGFPTLNLKFKDLSLAFGVYLIQVFELNGPRIKAIANYGVSPSFHNNEEPRLEIHFPNQSSGFWQNWGLGTIVRVELEQFIRKEQQFSDPEALKAQISSDIRYYEEWN